MKERIYDMKIMVTGAAGGYGHYAVDYVKQFAPEAEVYGLVRNADDAAALEAKGIHACIGDYADKSSLVKAFEGIDRLLFVSVPVHDLQINVVEAAKEAGIKYIAYTSIADPQYSKFTLEVNHRQTEQLIKESGIAYTILRDNWYTELISDFVKACIQTGRFPYFATEGKVAFALRREYAEAGARVITGEGYPEILTFAGTPVTFAELAEVAEEAGGKKLDVKVVTRDDFEKAFTDDEISPLGKMLGTNYQDYALAGNNGEEDLSPKELERVLGHAISPLVEALIELI